MTAQERVRLVWPQAVREVRGGIVSPGIWSDPDPMADFLGETWEEVSTFDRVIKAHERYIRELSEPAPPWNPYTAPLPEVLRQLGRRDSSENSDMRFEQWFTHSVWSSGGTWDIKDAARAAWNAALSKPSHISASVEPQEHFIGSEERRKLTAFVCGEPKCKSGKHKWDGPPVRRGNMGSASCSKCGALAYDAPDSRGSNK